MGEDRAAVTPEALIGAWELCAWTCTRDGVEHGAPFGESPRGLLVYSTDGYMAAVLGRADVAATGTVTLAAAPAEVRARAAANTVAYAGSWGVVNGAVVHQVRVALHPDQVGTTLLRFARIDQDGSLVLQTAPERSRRGYELVNRLVWRRPAAARPGP
jgi:hypothetical protein